MKIPQTLTVSCKIEVSLHQVEKLDAVLRTFSNCCEYVLIQHAKKTNQAIALEDLTGIRERTNQQPRSKTERRRSNSWAFYQLRQFLTYKAVKFGVSLVFVDPRYTSQTCHKCLHIHPVKGESYRSGKKFGCGHCGWSGDADENGAVNISALGLLFLDQPGGSGLACSLLAARSRATEIPDFSVSKSGKFKTPLTILS